MTEADSIFALGLAGGFISGMFAGYGLGAWIFGRHLRRPKKDASNSKGD